MPLTLPAKQVSWNMSLQNRCTYSSLNQAAGDVMYKVAYELITGRGFTCKGSSTGTVAAMDGTFRWTGGNDAKTRANGANLAQSWVAITLSGGRGDIVFSYNAATDDVYNIWWSPGGVATAQATATFEPTASDQVLLNKFFTTTPGTIVGTATVGDRLVSIWSNPNKGGFRVSVANGGAWQSQFGVDVFSPDTYGTGIILLDVAPFYINGAWNAMQIGSVGAQLMNSTQLNSSAVQSQKIFKGRRTDGGGTTLDLGHRMKWVASTGSSSPVVNLEQGYAPELQGGASRPMKRFGLYSTTTSHRGDVGITQDWYVGTTITTADGDTAGALDWICIDHTSSFWWPWDSTTPIVMN